MAEVHPSLTTVLTMDVKSVAVSSYPICVQMWPASMLPTNASASPDPYAFVMWITATLSCMSAVMTSATTDPWNASLGTTR